MMIKKFFVLLFCLCILESTDLHAGSIQYSLNDNWHFQKEPSGPVKGVIEPETIVNLPHSWNRYDAFSEDGGYYMDWGVYTKTVTIPKSLTGKRLFLYFEGANLLTQVSVNGKKAGPDHLGGYASFAYEVTSFMKEGENKVKVSVTNGYDPDIPPLIGGFTRYGGIYRDLFLIATENIHFDKLDHGSCGVYISTPIISETEGQVVVKSRIKNDGLKSQLVELKTRIVDSAKKTVITLNKTQTVKPGQLIELSDQGVVQKPQLWSPENPYLYTVVTSILDKATGEVLDEVENPLGFRWFGFDEKRRFMLNGKPYKLVGVNRHQDYMGMANALPNELIIRDVKLMKEMGVNCLRIAHYQQDPILLEACDKYGLICSEEIPLMNNIASRREGYKTDPEKMTENCIFMIRELVKRDYNHPSIVFWAYMNEILITPPVKRGEPGWDEYSKAVTELARKLDHEIKSLDNQRLTMIPHYNDVPWHVQHGLTEVPSVNGWNLYWGWYDRQLEDFGPFFDDITDGIGGPHMVTEYGAGGDPRLRSLSPNVFDFSLDYQLTFHRHYLEEILKRDNVSGSFVWNFADFGNPGQKDAVPYINNKGLMTIDRRCKDSYYYYQVRLVKKPLVVIPSKLWAHRGGMMDTPGSATCTQSVLVFGNQKKVELLLDGKSLGIQPIKNGVADFKVPFHDGRNKLIARSKVKWGITVTDHFDIDFDLYSYDLSKGKMPFRQLNINVGSNCFFIDEETKCLWLPDQPYRKGAFGYVDGDIFYTAAGGNKRIGNNIDVLGTDKDPVYQTQIRGLTEYRVDVPDGRYEVTVGLVELLGRQQRETLYQDLAENSRKDELLKGRVFDAAVNGVLLFDDLDLEKNPGTGRLLSRKIIVDAENGEGIHVSFKAAAGEAVLNALQVRKIY